METCGKVIPERSGISSGIMNGRPCQWLARMTSKWEDFLVPLKSLFICMPNQLLRTKGKTFKAYNIIWWMLHPSARKLHALLPLIHKKSWKDGVQMQENPCYSKVNRNKFYYILSIFTMIRVNWVKGVSERWTNNANTNPLSCSTKKH